MGAVSAHVIFQPRIFFVDFSDGSVLSGGVKTAGFYKNFFGTCLKRKLGRLRRGRVPGAG
ncbi:MAG: hypothetical protein CMQ39_01105 [Gammaproteobacteria bacterium]|nr:hypothetical protein [Gammaproteobacteria bacterium]